MRLNNSNQDKQDLSKPKYNASGRSFSGWLGGKSQLARTIIEMMPEHKVMVHINFTHGYVKKFSLYKISDELLKILILMNYSELKYLLLKSTLNSS